MHTFALAELWANRVVSTFPFHHPCRPTRVIGQRPAASIERREQAPGENLGIAQDVHIEGYLLKFPLHHGRSLISTRYFVAWRAKLCTLPPVIRPEIRLPMDNSRSLF